MVLGWPELPSSWPLRRSLQTPRSAITFPIGSCTSGRRSLKRAAFALASMAASPRKIYQSSDTAGLRCSGPSTTSRDEALLKNPGEHTGARTPHPPALGVLTPAAPSRGAPLDAAPMPGAKPQQASCMAGNCSPPARAIQVALQTAPNQQAVPSCALEVLSGKRPLSCIGRGIFVHFTSSLPSDLCHYHHKQPQDSYDTNTNAHIQHHPLHGCEGVQHTSEVGKNSWRPLEVLQQGLGQVQVSFGVGWGLGYRVCSKSPSSGQHLLPGQK